MAMAASIALKIFARLFLCWKLPILKKTNRPLEFSFSLALLHNWCWLRYLGKKWDFIIIVLLILFIYFSSEIPHRFFCKI